MAETLNQKSAAEYLGISVTSLKSLEDEGKLQRQRNMPGVKYRIEDLDALQGAGKKNLDYKRLVNENLALKERNSILEEQLREIRKVVTLYE